MLRHKRLDTMTEPLHEIITGRPRPRHLRFASALAELLPGTKIERRDRSLMARLRINAVCRLTGIRQVAIPDSGPPVLLHQALTSVRRHYATEFDVPLGVHGYSYQTYLKHGDVARGLLEAPSLKSIFVFSEWARRSFALHYGDEVGAKCRISYPLAAPQAQFGGSVRRFDFTFISNNFRIKCGPELVRAFKAVRASGAPDARMCLVTDLDEARRLLGELTRFEGIEWRAANLDQAAIADLLCESHCLVHPTLAESFGVVVLEALAAGCAVITSAMASLPELVTKANGILLPVPFSTVVGEFPIPMFGNAAAFSRLMDRANLSALERDLTEAMVALATDSGLRARLQQGARDLYDQRFSRAAWLERMRVDLGAAFPDLVPTLALGSGHHHSH